MSDLDRENLRKEEKATLINISANNGSNQGHDPTLTQQTSKRKIIFGVIGGLVIIGIILAIVLPLTLKKKDPGPGPTEQPDNPINPFDWPEYNPYVIDDTQLTESVFNAEYIINDASWPKSQESAKLFMGYEATNNDYKPVNPSNIPVRQSNNEGTPQIRLNIDMVNNYNVRILAQDNNNIDSSMKAPESVFSRPVFEHEARLTQVNFKKNNKPFSFSFGNIYTKNEILSTQNRKLFISDKFSEMGFILPTRRCYGLGQRNGQFLLQKGAYTMHSRARVGPLPSDDGLGGKNGNHIHPFILCQSKDKDFFGMFFVSNAPQHFEILQFDGDDRQILNYISLSNTVEVFVMMRGTAQDIIQRYHAMIGFSQVPPYYALGVFQGSDSYDSLKKVTDVYSQYGSLQLTLEGVIATNFNQQKHQTFTINSQTFADLASAVGKIHQNKQKMILGASLAIQGNYPIFQKSIFNKCLVDSMVYPGQQVMGVLDQTEVYYIDPFHDGTQPFFEQTLPDFYQQTGGFDGLVIQDAHLPNHITGEIVQSEESQKVLLGVQQNEENYGSYEPYRINSTQTEVNTYWLPFLPYNNGASLDEMSISLNASQGGGDQTIKRSNMFIHNANSHTALQKVRGALLKGDQTKTQRPLLLTDSSWAGTGALGVGLVTDLYRSWDNLRNMINQVFSLSMSGMNALMVDGCGSVGPMDEDLCSRWMQVAAFMPLVRNYYNSSYIDENGQWQQTPGSEPYNYKNQDSQFAYTSALNQRLNYHRYIYSQLYSAYRVGGAVVRPLFFDYPEDDNTYNNIESTYMLGDSIKVSPVLEKGKKDGDKYQAYFPQGVWYSLNDPYDKMDLTSGGKNVDLTVNNAFTNIHLKGGKIIPYQRNDKGLKVTHDFETNLKMSFIIGRDAAKSYADGYILVDDGISADSYDNEKYTFWKLRYAEKSINFWVEYGNFNYVPPEGYTIHQLRDIQILDAEDLGEPEFACYLGLNMSPVQLDHDYNEFTKILTIKPMGDAVITFKDIGMIKFGSKGDANLCDPNTYTYKVSNTFKEEQTLVVYNLTNAAGSDVNKPLVASFQLLDDFGTINVQITTQEDYDNPAIIYKVPTPEVYSLDKFDTSKVTKNIKDFLNVIQNPFSYEIYKDVKKTDTFLWKSDANKLYFSDYFVMDSGIFKMNKNIDQPLIGMGERAGSLFYKNEEGGIHSRYTFDQANPIDDGLPPGRNMYGYQPFYAFQSAIDTTFDWFGVFDVSSYATDYIIYSDNGKQAGETQIHKITIGGTINKFFFSGLKPDDLIKTYSKLVGTPTLPPLWAFGWHQCRFGYVTDEQWFEVYNTYKQQGFPLEAMWADIDYMDDYKLFTISPQSYPNITKYIDQVHQDDRYFVPIMDAGVAVRLNQGYKALDDGLDKNVFILQADKTHPLTAGVWCGNAYFPDFFKPETVEWWQNNFEYLNTTLNFQFDGIWLDENEATNFCNGYCKPEERPAQSLRNKPFYVPGWRDLEDKAIGVDGYHSSINRTEYDVHNLYSLMQTKATAEFLINKKLRPYILTRANYPGIGKYGHHWMGDNWSDETYMALSVDGVYSYNLFGLPFMGSDICGFNGDATPDLCTRWHILGSFYPFARNHNQNASASQEPYVFNEVIPNQQPGQTMTYSDVIKIALTNRYCYIRYYYSSFYDIYLDGGSFFKPLFYEFPLDKKAYDDIEINILLGNGIKLSMETTNLDFVKNPSVTKNFYFPEGTWCIIYPWNFKDGCFESQGGDNGYLTLPTGLQDSFMHIRNGYIVPFQDSFANVVKKSKDLEVIATDLFILPTISASAATVAEGFVFFDDGISALPAPYARFAMQLNKNADNSYTMTFARTGSLDKGFGNMNENVGTVYFFSAAKTGFATIKTAEVKTATGTKTYNLDQFPDYDRAQVSIKDASYWDIQSIDFKA